jgi:hypothetical protein
VAAHSPPHELHRQKYCDGKDFFNNVKSGAGETVPHLRQPLVRELLFAWPPHRSHNWHSGFGGILRHPEILYVA